MLRGDKNHKPVMEGSATRRGFLFGLLGGLAGAAGLTAIVARFARASSLLPGTAPAQGRTSSKPIDNIFVPLRSPKREPRGR